MEFAVAVLSAAASAAASSAVSKLGMVISTKLKGKTKTDATYIKNELQWIQSEVIPLLADAAVHPRVEGLHKLRRLRRLAYEIEDCLDCFQVNKMTAGEFAEEVAGLKKISEEMHKQLLEQLQIESHFRELALTSSAQGQGQQPSASVVRVPQEIHELLGKQSKDYLNCLLYFCMFPHDHHARRNPLIRRWLAEGLVQGEGAAVEYLKTLIDGKIITTIAKSNNGMMKRCQPPDEILRFIKEQSSSTDFMLFCDDMDNLQPECARRLSLHPKEETLGDLNLPEYSNLHTLSVFYRGSNPGCYQAILKHDNKYEIKYEVLRVLDLKECAPLCEGHFLAICKLLLLKYLSFRSGIDHLPSQIGKLEWLETLDLSGSHIVTVPAEVLWMPRLKHLLGKFQLSRWESFDMTSRAFFDWKTKDLRNFLKKKSVLQTLSGFVTGERLGFPQLISLMRKLKKVKIWCKSNASEANLNDISSAIKKFILDGIQDPGRSLSLDFQECSGQFLNTLPAGGSLTSLKLRGNLSEFPQFVARLSAIEELCLSSTSLSWDQILPGLSKLGILKYLKLVEDNLDVKILPQHLRSLQRICLVCVQRLDIAIQAGAVPNLVSLHLICKNLDVIPGTPDMEITDMAGLQEVGLHPQVDQAIKLGWENAAETHPKKPIVLDVHIPLM